MIGETIAQPTFQIYLIFINRFQLFFYQTFFPKGYEKRQL